MWKKRPKNLNSIRYMICVAVTKFFDRRTNLENRAFFKFSTVCRPLYYKRAQKEPLIYHSISKKIKLCFCYLFPFLLLRHLIHWISIRKSLANWAYYGLPKQFVRFKFFSLPYLFSSGLTSSWLCSTALNCEALAFRFGVRVSRKLFFIEFFEKRVFQK